MAESGSMALHYSNTCGVSFLPVLLPTCWQGHLLAKLPMDPGDTGTLETAGAESSKPPKRAVAKYQPINPSIRWGVAKREETVL